MTLRAVSLFSGAGGFDFGFEEAGFDIVYANELNKDSASSWKANRESNADAMHVGDILQMQSELELLEDIDIVFGGPPCQGFSIAGKMKADDPRNHLAETFISVVAAIKPTVFVMENVKALATHQKWVDIRTSLECKAAEAGYEAKFGVFQVLDFGVSERRERMLFVGVRPGNGKVDDFFSGMERRKSAPMKLRDLLNAVGQFGSPQNPNTSTAKITIAKNPVLRGSAYSGMLVNGSGRPIDLDSFSPTLTASMGGNRTPIIDQLALESTSRTNWFVSLYEDLVSEKEYEKEIPSHIRRLTIREAAAIQSFPSSYIFNGSKCSQYRQIGNAVPPLFSKAIAETLLEACFQPKKEGKVT